VSEWPAVFLREERAKTPQPLADFHDVMEAECLVNHVHVLDKLQHSADLPAEPFWNVAHPDFLQAIELAIVIAEAWASKLARDFPDRRFAVFATRDTPSFAFMQFVRTALWMEQRGFASDGSALMILVGAGGIYERVGHLTPMVSTGTRAG
jgi:hypothetical protein